ncbi:hypothetical protein EEL32_17870 [Brevibacillus laterosporus]|uniref:Uncharacterized protein n=1 Tax=Brevibacillus laterosporus TaxID=1465 RepID=A0A502IDD9_BRELA|nr:hypothetical protein [Brevibacillus laterosporus]QDX91879.1 hypothetical protein EEL30_05570 [Brevibacillus laterosporus]TPG70234.1 hypothetical protein EEL31_18220 [Brevibacillus laterosporus]TPG83626.1 hypothetical protein EEL32_17870 [Brevibacillus laterosporus]
MFKIGIAFLFGAFTHLFLTLVYAEYMSLEMFKIIGSKSAYDLNSSFYSLFYWELAISAAIILLSFFIKKEPK